MRNKSDRVVLITGATSGMGRRFAHHLHGRGYTVYGTSRYAGGEVPPSSFKVIQMDVTSDASVRKGVRMIQDREGRLDIVVNNAGISISGSVEDTPIKGYRKQFETNFLGVIRVCHSALPIMRRQKYGYIVNVSSLGGLIGMPFDSAYCASKFALEGFTEALRMEVRRFGIRVCMLEPGDVNTGMTKRNIKNHQTDVSSAYREIFEKVLDANMKSEEKGISPQKVARLLERIVSDPSPRLRYPVANRTQQIAAGVMKYLPERWKDPLRERLFDLS